MKLSICVCRVTMVFALTCAYNDIYIGQHVLATRSHLVPPHRSRNVHYGFQAITVPQLLHDLGSEALASAALEYLCL